jgi:hypothetical protein
MLKRIVQVLPGMPASDGAGVKLTRALGQPRLKHIDPFLMIDEIKSDDPNDYIAGFPSHPHKGFETLTYLMHGSMEHKDSTGGHGLIESGGVQYMTAGKGIIHSETPQQDNGLLWGFQLWVNLPAENKLIDATYVDIGKEQIPTLNLNEAVRAKLIAGHIAPFEEVGPVVREDIAMQIYDVESSEASTVTIDLQEAHQGYVYVYKGRVGINGHDVPSAHIAQFSEGTQLDISMTADAGILIVAGTPIGEPIVQYGPFVMNTMAEIEEAITDFQSGRFV